MAESKIIMLVDDDVDFVELTGRALEKAGYTVATAYSAQECREKVVAVLPDLVVLDVMMESETAGFELAHELQKIGQIKSMPILMVTSINKKVKFPWKYEETSDKLLPVHSILEKPVAPERLLAQIAGILESQA